MTFNILTTTQKTTKIKNNSANNQIKQKKKTLPISTKKSKTYINYISMKCKFCNELRQKALAAVKFADLNYANGCVLKNPVLFKYK